MQQKKIKKELENHPPKSPIDDPVELPKEINGRGGLEPTRYGDWEKNGRCIDF